MARTLREVVEAKVERLVRRHDWGQWVEGLAPWCWYCTLTFRDIERRGTWSRPGLAYAKRGWYKFEQRAERLAGNRVQWLAAWEWQEERGVPHVHALMAGCEYVSRLGMRDWWYKEYGLAQVMTYDARRGGAEYLAKYLDKPGLIQLEFSDTIKGGSLG